MDLSGVREIPEEESPLNATPALSTTSRVAIQKPTAALPNSSGVDIEETEQVISSYLPPTVVEIAQEPLLKESESWWLDVGLPDGDVRLSTHLVLEDRQIAYLENFFVGKEKVVHYAGWDDRGPVIISVVPNVNSKSDDEKFRVLLHSQEGTFQLFVPSHASSRTKLVQHISSIEPVILDTLKLKQVKHPELEAELLKMEKQRIISTYKFGILYCAPGQSQEDEMYSNVEASPAFNTFCNLLGEKIELQGWDHYAGGLDCKANKTGTHSYYTQWQGMEVMFHVSTLLPYSPNDKAQIQRKRYIGNDIVMIVFKEGRGPIDTSVFRSRYTHCVACVQFEGSGKYRLNLANKKGVRHYGPHFQRGQIFEHGHDFRELLLTKLINAERAAYTAPGFRQKFSRTRLLALEYLVQKLEPSLKPAKSNSES